jgi:CheY-like chemotaxis protein/tetratricopeptide (TPR) repeat protein
MSRTVLCADADRNLCQILARALGADGMRVASAHDGDEALRAVAQAGPDVAILELALPGRDGLEVLAAIRRRSDGRARIPVLLLAAAAPDPPQIEQARRLRASAILVKPVALDTLAARIERMLADRAGKGGSEKKAAARPRVHHRAAPLRGRLENLPFPALLHEVHGLRAAGVLRLDSGPRRKEIELVDGRPASVRSNVPGERLGEWLLRTGRIARDAYEESLRRMERGEGLQGGILLAMQALSESQLVEALREHADAKLFEIFEWKEGRFELTLGARLERASALGVARSAADVIRIGVATGFPIERVDAALGARAGDVAFTASNPFYSFQEIKLGDAEQRLLGAAARGLALRKVLAHGPEIRRAAYALLETGLLELRDGEALRRGEAAARVPLHGPRPEPSASARAPGASAPVPVPDPALGASPPRAAARPEPAAAARDHAHYAPDQDQREALTALLVRLRNPSPFEKLGLRPDAAVEEIRTAYTELAKRTHPDRYAAASQAVRSLAEEAFREITRAYDVLSDPERLELYRRDPQRDHKDARATEEAQRVLSAEQEFQRGESRLRAYDWAGALAHFERAVELYPDEGEYLAYCGWAYYLTHGHEPDVMRKAVALVKRGIKLAPERDTPYLFLGRLCQATGRLDIAEKMFMEAVERRPDSTEALRELRLLTMRRPKGSLVGRLIRRATGGPGSRRR